MNRDIAHSSENVGLRFDEANAQGNRDTVRQFTPAVVAGEARSLGRTAGRTR